MIRKRSGVDSKAIAAREAEVVAKPLRVSPVKLEEMSEEAHALIDRIRVSAGAGKAAEVPEYFRVMVKHFEIFRSQLEMGTAIYNGAIPKRERELAVLRVAWLVRAPYEWGEHVDIGKRCGLTTEEVERVIDGSKAKGWSKQDKAILKAVEELLADQAISDKTWAKLAKIWNEKQLIEFPMMVGQYVATAFVQNSLRIRLADDNPGLTHR